MELVSIVPPSSLRKFFHVLQINAIHLWWSFITEPGFQPTVHGVVDLCIDGMHEEQRGRIHAIFCFQAQPADRERIIKARA